MIIAQLATTPTGAVALQSSGNFKKEVTRIVMCCNLAQ